jgi:hypothetical protein
MISPLHRNTKPDPWITEVTDIPCLVARFEGGSYHTCVKEAYWHSEQQLLARLGPAVTLKTKCSQAMLQFVRLYNRRKVIRSITPGAARLSEGVDASSRQA